MAQSHAISARRPRKPAVRSVLLLRLAIVVTILAAWEALSRSGLLFRDVVPSGLEIGRALIALLGSAEFYWHLSWTLLEIGAALALGGILGLTAGLILGTNRLFNRAFVPYLYYLGSTPKLIFFPVMVMFFGVGPSSKIALGLISCFFPIALSTAEGVRRIAPVYVKVGRSLGANAWHMVRHIYLPAMREPVISGIRLGLGIAMVVTLLAETKLSNRGIGYLIIQAFNVFAMPRMYALLIAMFAVAIAANVLVGRLSRSRASTTLSGLL